MIKYTLAIDPGGNGGIVVLNEYGTVVEMIKCPDTDKDILLALEPYSPKRGDISIGATVWIEKLWGHGGLMGSKASIWAQAENYGMLKMAVIAMGMRMEEIPPSKWQKHYSIKKEKGMAPKEWKAILRDKAQKMYPEQKVTLWNSDALLIAKYGYEQTYTPTEN